MQILGKTNVQSAFCLSFVPSWHAIGEKKLNKSIFRHVHSKTEIIWVKLLSENKKKVFLKLHLVRNRFIEQCQMHSHHENYMTMLWCTKVLQTLTALTDSCFLQLCQHWNEVTQFSSSHSDHEPIIMTSNSIINGQIIHIKKKNENNYKFSFIYRSDNLRKDVQNIWL